MSGTCTTANLIATLNNLNMTGTFAAAHASDQDVTIPPATIGLYQLMNQLISTVSSLKATIKTNEKVLIAKLKADSDGTTTLDDSTSSRSATQQSSTNSAVGDQRGGLTATVADKPAIITSGTAAHNYSEDVVFDLLSGITWKLMQLNGDVDIDTGALAACSENN